MLGPAKSFIYPSDSGSYERDPNWYSCSEYDSDYATNRHDTNRGQSDFTKELPLKHQGRSKSFVNSSRTPMNAKVKPLEVQHVVGLNKDSNRPLVFDERGLVAYLTGPHVTVLNWQTNCQVLHLSRKAEKRLLACLAISNDGTLLASGEHGVDPSVLVWRLDSFSIPECFELRGHANTITALSFSPNGNFLASLGNIEDSRLIVWDCHTGVPLFTQNLNIQANLTALSFSSDSSILFTATGKTQFTAWQLSHRGSNSLRDFPEDLFLCSKPVMPSLDKATDFIDIKTVVMGKSSFLLALCQQGVLYKLRLQAGSYTIEKKIDLRVSSAFSMDLVGTRIAVSCASGIVKIIRTKNMAIEATVAKPSPDQKDSNINIVPDAKFCAFDREGLTLAVIYSDSSLVFWNIEDITDIQILRTVHSHSSPILDVFPMPTYSRDQGIMDRNLGRTMRSPTLQDPQDLDNEFATCSDKGVINLWNLRMHTPSLRHPPFFSPTAESSQRNNNFKVEVGIKSIFLNPPIVRKSRAATGKRKVIPTSVKAKNEARKPVASTTTPLSKKKPVASKKKPATSKTSAAATNTTKSSKPAVKRKGTSLKSTVVKGKTIRGTATPVRLSTDLSQSKIIQSPASGWKDSVVTVPRVSNSRLASLEASGSGTDSSEEPQLTCLRVNPNGMQAVVGDVKGQLRIVDLPTEEVICRKTVHNSRITAIEFSQPGKDGELLLATGAEDGTVKIMDVNKDFEVVLEKTDHEQAVTGISFSPEGTAVVSCAKDRYIYFESLEDPGYQSEEDMELYFSRHCLHESECEGIHFNSARQTYMVACSDHLIRVYNTVGQFVHSLRIPEELGAPTKIVQGPIQSMIITCHADNHICIFEYFTGSLIARGESHATLTGAMVINKGRNLVTTTEDGMITIWKLDETLLEACRSSPDEMAVTQDEAGYTSDLYRLIQNERGRSAAVVGELNNYPAIRCRQRNISPPPLFCPIPLSSRSSIDRSRASSRLSNADASLFIPIADKALPKKTAPKLLPSWVKGGSSFADEAFRSDLESMSPALSRPPKLNLHHTSGTEDEDYAIPSNVLRKQTILQTGYSDHDGLPIEHFTLGRNSQESFRLKSKFSVNRRFSSPVTSSRWGGFKNDSPLHSGSHLVSPGFDLNPNSSLQVYEGEHDFMDGRLRRRSGSTDRPWDRPTGPEPPSSVSCDSDSRHCTPFDYPPRGSFESEDMLPLHETGISLDDDDKDGECTSVKDSFARVGPIGPNIYKRGTRTPTQTLDQDEKRIYSRPNSEEHTNKMLSENLPESSDSDTLPTVYGAEPERLQSFWPPLNLGDDDTYYTDSDTDEMEVTPENVCPPVPDPDALVLKAGGLLKGNPLYSSGSESSERAYHSTVRMSALNSTFNSSSPITQEAEEKWSMSSSTSSQSEVECVKSHTTMGKMRTSMEDFKRMVKSQLRKTLAKLVDGPSYTHGTSESCVLMTPRKKAFVDETEQKLMSLFGSSTAKSS